MPKSYELPAPGQPFDPNLFTLGTPCKRNHIHANGMTLRKAKGRQCVLCQRIDSAERQRKLREDPAFRRKQADAVAAKRKQFGRPSRSRHGLPYTPLPDAETRSMRKAVRRAGQFPTVADLVAQQQSQHWLSNPEDKRHCCNPWSRQAARYRYLVDQSYRLYHRQKAKHYKAMRRGNVAELISGERLLQRWKQFDCCCAYCGTPEHQSAELEIEHIVPISKGGPHLLSNIVPACARCNDSKGSKDVETWMRQQPFFDVDRFSKIKSFIEQAKLLAPQETWVPVG